MGFNPLESLFGGGDDAADASIEASKVQADYQREALDYLKETEALPQQYREASLGRLAGVYGLEGGTGSQQELIDQAIASPLYQQLIGTRESGEEAILRQAGATGGLRSGNVQQNLYDYNVQLENQALLEAYNQQLTGLGSMAQLPSLAPQIASGTSAIGTTLGQGQIAAAQAQAQGGQAGMGNLLGLTGLGIEAYGSGMFSDRCLKKNIKYVGDVKSHKWYTWDWNYLANRLGLKGSSCGVLADEAFEKNRESVILKDGFLFVKYEQLGVF